MKRYRIGLIIGSNSRESINRQLARAAVMVAPPELEFFDIAIDELPMFNRDLLVNVPAAVQTFANQCRRADGFMIAMPEHNRSLPAMLKNAIDWGSKPKEQCLWFDKPCAITGTSPGAIGTAVGQQHLRQILGILGAVVLGGEAYIAFKPDLIGPDGGFATDTTQRFMRDYMTRFHHLVERLG